MRLGWRSPRANMLQGPNAEVLKGVFGDLQRFMTWPHVGLRFDGTFNMTGTLASPAWVPKSAAASPFVEGDPYRLWRSGPKVIQVPRDFTTWMAIGSAGFTTTGGAAADLLTAGWRINGVNGEFFSHMSGNPASRVSVPFMAPVKKGDTIDIVVATNNLAEDLTDAEAWLVFLPLA